MADESIGTARIDIVVGTDQMDVAIERAKSRMSSMSTEAQKAYAGLNAAEKKRIDSLIKQADTLGFTREQQILYNAALKGTPVAILDELKAKMGGVKTSTEQAATAATKAFSGTNKSARELQFAMRGLPAQFTDIFTSLASGQRPMMVLLQQGGQVKDMFGGIAPALRAVGSGILAMINPLTVSVGVAAALAFAWKEGSDEATAYNKALITTGNYAGVTAARMNDMAAAIGGAVGTQHEAAKVLAEVAASGKFTGEQIERVGKAALEMSRMTGQATSETIKQFESLQDKPLEAILKLNDAQHFLTTAIYEQIKALEDEGRAQDAADLATKTYADAVDERTQAVVENLGLVEKAWKGIKDATLAAGSAIAAIGRAPTDQMQFDALATQRDALIHNRDALLSQLGGAAPGAASQRMLAGFQANIDVLTKQMATMQDKLIAEQKAASKKSLDAQAAQAVIDSDAEAALYATKEEKRVKEVLAAHNKATAEVEKAFAAGDQASAERIAANYTKIVAGIEAKYADKATKSKKADSDPFASLNGLVRDATAFDQGVGVDAEQNKQAAAIRKIVDAGAKLIESGHDVATVQATVAIGVEKLNEGYAKQAAILRNQNVVSLDAYRNAIKQQIADRQRQIDLQVASIGMGEKEAQQQLAIAEIYTRVNKTIEQLNRQRAQKNANTEFIDGEIAAQKASIPILVKQEQDKWKAIDEAQADGMNGVHKAIVDFMDQQKDMAGQMRDITTDLIGGFGDAFASFASGAESAKKAFGDLIDDMYKQALRAVANKALQSILGYFFDPTGGSGEATYNALGGVTHINFGGGRASGGPVAAGNAYQVVEDGPELLNVGSRTYLMMGNQAGHVTPLSESKDTANRSPTYITNINVQPTSTRRTAEQVATATARVLRIAQARNG